MRKNYYKFFFKVKLVSIMHGFSCVLYSSNTSCGLFMRYYIDIEHTLCIYGFHGKKRGILLATLQITSARQPNNLMTTVTSSQRKCSLNRQPLGYARNTYVYTHYYTRKHARTARVRIIALAAAPTTINTRIVILLSY